MHECGDEKGLVYIDATADGIDDLHLSSSSWMICEGKGSDWITAQLTMS
jgi:hypothetical protein